MLKELGARTLISFENSSNNIPDLIDNDRVGMIGLFGTYFFGVNGAIWGIS
ncbi:hypothetical protein [Paenibacillus sp. L3-i20]|uniref:hypothetical protein n=1 Tax=Paenibacillus sp. L3-i20 TaxID=2905833 RepID=UPI00208BB439|nr:hypothetical protein [Paenibacillus sp. L3-i20]GKU75923.1 hypothetical protein L3i20_v203200 [Paenibacillus sp. L3-i20]